MDAPETTFDDTCFLSSEILGGKEWKRKRLQRMRINTTSTIHRIASRVAHRTKGGNKRKEREISFMKSTPYGPSNAKEKQNAHKMGI